MNSKKVIIILALLIVLLLVVGLITWKSSDTPKFTAVYLTSGDLFFGKQINFPNYGLKQVYSIQVNSEDEESPISIQKFENNFWGPEDFLRINRDNVIWTVRLDSAGQLAQLIRDNPELNQPQNQEVIPTN